MDHICSLVCGFSTGVWMPRAGQAHTGWTGTTVHIWRRRSFHFFRDWNGSSVACYFSGVALDRRLDWHFAGVKEKVSKVLFPQPHCRGVRQVGQEPSIGSRKPWTNRACAALERYSRYPLKAQRRYALSRDFSAVQGTISAWVVFQRPHSTTRVGRDRKSDGKAMVVSTPLKSS